MAAAEISVEKYSAGPLAELLKLRPRMAVSGLYLLCYGLRCFGIELHAQFTTGLSRLWLRYGLIRSDFVYLVVRVKIFIYSIFYSQSNT